MPEIVSVRSQLNNALNQLRVRNGIGRVTANPQLRRIAQDYACLLARTGHFDHIGPDGSTLVARTRAGGYDYCVIAENLAFGQRNVAEVMRSWIGSAGHYANLRRDGVDEVGLGMAMGPEPGTATTDDADSEPTEGGGLSALASRYGSGSTHESTPAPRRRGHRAARPYWVMVLGRRC